MKEGREGRRMTFHPSPNISNPQGGGREGGNEGGREGRLLDQRLTPISQPTYRKSPVHSKPLWQVGYEGGKEGGREGWRKGGRGFHGRKIYSFINFIYSFSFISIYFIALSNRRGVCVAACHGVQGS